MGTQDDIVRLAIHYIQTNGVNGFSYADIAREMNLKKPSIHYYFPTKADLVRTALKRYSVDFFKALHQGTQNAQNLRENLDVYVQLYRKNLTQDYKLCLCSMLALESVEPSSGTQNQVSTKSTATTAEFQEKNIAWIIERFKEAGCAPNIARREAELLFATVQGAQIMARSARNLGFFDDVTTQHLETLIQRIENPRDNEP